MEMLIRTLLNYFGFTREQFDIKAREVMMELENFKLRAQNTEALILEIRADQKKILAWIQAQETGKKSLPFVGQKANGQHQVTQSSDIY